MSLNFTINNHLEMAGFCSGFIWSIDRPKDVVEYPISTVFWGSACGSIAGSFCSLIAEEMIPLKIRPVFTGILIASSGYHVYKLFKSSGIAL